MADRPTSATDPHMFPQVTDMGLDGLLVRFADTLSEPANRAAIAFRVAVEDAGWPGIAETSTALVSCFVRVAVGAVDPEALRHRLTSLARSRDWRAARLPQGRRLWRIPTLYGTERAPQLGEAARLAGLTEQEAAAQLAAVPNRILALGFAPGQPYVGLLPPHWDVPRMAGVSPQVPPGALVQAVRQFVLFTIPAPTGWRHVGQTAFRCFRPEAPDPIPLRPGDEVQFTAVSRAAFEALEADGVDGAETEVLP